MQLWPSRTYKKEDKIYRGAFNYFRNDSSYAEETFDVYKDKKDQTLHYVSEAVVKVTTGEILNIHVEYIVNKEFVPTFVLVEKIMGKESTKETYEYHGKRNYISYNFTNNRGDSHTDEITTAPRFHISTPTAASSITFIRSKKFDNTGKNSFNVLCSFNQWEYIGAPLFKNVILERAALTQEKMTIDGQSVNATQYKMFDEHTDFKNLKEPPHIKIFLSPHGAVPYLIKGEDSTKIQIKYLNDLADKD